MLGRQLICKFPFLVGSPSSPVDENIEITRSLFAPTSFLLLVRKVCVCVRAQSCQTLQTQWTVASQAPLSMGLSWQEYWSGLPFPSPGDLPTQRLSLYPLWLLHWQVDSLPLSYLGRQYGKFVLLVLSTSLVC